MSSLRRASAIFASFPSLIAFCTWLARASMSVQSADRNYICKNITSREIEKTVLFMLLG
jgi:hypothetical protein